MKTQSHDGKSLDSTVRIIAICDFDSHTDLKNEVEMVITRANATSDYAVRAIADCEGGPFEDADLSNKIFEEVYEQYQKRHTTEEIDWLSAKLALAIP